MFKLSLLLLALISPTTQAHRDETITPAYENRQIYADMTLEEKKVDFYANAPMREGHLTLPEAVKKTASSRLKASFDRLAVVLLDKNRTVYVLYDSTHHALLLCDSDGAECSLTVLEGYAALKLSGFACGIDEVAQCIGNNFNSKELTHEPIDAH